MRGLRLWSRFLETALALLIACVPTFARMQIDGLVRGRDGAPISGAQVSLHRPLSPLESTLAVGAEKALGQSPVGSIATTDGEGRFRITDIPRGVYFLVCRKGGFAPVVLPGVAVDGTRGVALPTLTMEPGHPASGRFVAADGTPLGGRVVYFRPCPPGGLFNVHELPLLLKTDSEGRYETTESASPFGDVQLQWDETRIAGRLSVSADEMRSPQSVVIEFGATLDGKLTKADGAPLPDAHFDLGIVGATCTRVTAKTDGSGAFSLAELPAGDIGHCKARCGSVRFRSERPQGRLRPGKNVLTIKMKQVEEFAEGIRESPHAAVRGTITDGRKRPLPGVLVDWMPSGRASAKSPAPLPYRFEVADEFTVTDAAGRYSLEIPIGDIVVRARTLDGLAVLSAERTIEDTNPVEMETLMVRGADKGATRVIEGKVVDERGPVPGAIVVLSGPKSEEEEERDTFGLSKFDGTFRFDDMPLGAYRIYAVGMGVVGSQSTDVPSVSRGLIVKTRRAVMYRGVVKRADTPVEFACLTFEPKEAKGLDETRAFTAPDGSFTAWLAKDVDYALEIQRPFEKGDAKRSAFLKRFIDRMRAGEKEETFIVERGKEITGRVLRPDGSVVMKADINVAPADGQDPKRLSWTLDYVHEGKFRIAALPPGRYCLTFSRIDDLPSTDRILTAGDENVTIQLVRPGRIVGRVVDDRGQPLRGVWIGFDYSSIKRTRADGSFSFAGLDPGTYDLLRFVPIDGRDETSGLREVSAMKGVKVTSDKTTDVGDLRVE